MHKLGLLMGLGFALACAACGGSDDEPNQAASGGTSGVGGSGVGGSAGSSTGGSAGAAGGSSCPAGSHAVGSECDSTLAWTAAPAITKKRDHHVTFAAKSDAGKFLWAAGGIQDNTVALSSIERAPIAEDGSVGAWAGAGALPEPVIGGSVAQVGDAVILTAGIRPDANGKATLSDKTNIALVGADGKLGGFSDGPTLSVTRFHHGMAAHGDTIYVVGGLTGDNTDNTPIVEKATVSAGAIGTWAPTTPLPEKRSHHAVVVYDDGLFVIAGLTGNPAAVNTPLSDVLRAPIASDGSLGEWKTVGTLPVALATHAAFVHLGWVYVVAGVENDSSNTDAVRRAKIGGDGMLSEWESVANLPVQHAHAHQTPILDGVVYSVGGAFQHMSSTDVFWGKFE
jgi:hypothetical protein